MHELKLTRALILVPLLTGCGGLGITGGSVPVVKFRAVTGRALLPGANPLSNGAIAVRTVAARTPLQFGTTNNSGVYTLVNIPTSEAIEIVVSDSSGAVLRSIVSAAILQSGGSGTLKLPTITPGTTVAAAAIEMEVPSGAQNSTAIVDSQYGQLLQQVQNLGQDNIEQEGDITDSGMLQVSAFTVTTASINEELRTGAIHDALDGIVGYLQALRQSEVKLDDSALQKLITAQTAGHLTSAQALATELATAGISSATAAGVQQSSTAVRLVFPQLPASGAGISPFEALLIGGLPSAQGGFGLSSTALPAYAAGFSGG